MVTYWTMDGTIKPMSAKKAVNISDLDEIERICSEYGVDCTVTGDGAHLAISYYDDGSYGLFDDFANEIAPYIEAGSMDTDDEDEDAHTRYIFSKGEYKSYYGEGFLYYPGFEEEFIDALPKKVVDLIKSK